MHVYLASRRTAIAFMGFVLGTVPAAAQPLSSCEGPDTEPWVADFYERTMLYNGLAAFSVERWGSPIACGGEVTTEFDGVRYGVLRIEFNDAIALHVETMPIETGLVELRAALGFGEQEAETVAVLRAYAEGIGVNIDWDSPEISVSDGAEVRQFRDPAPGLNASASLVRRQGTLVAVRFSMAL